jgi:hypothetical protein
MLTIAEYVELGGGGLRVQSQHQKSAKRTEHTYSITNADASAHENELLYAGQKLRVDRDKPSASPSVIDMEGPSGQTMRCSLRAL